MTRMMKVILTLSVLLNVLLLGTVGSYAYKASQHRPEQHAKIRDQLSPAGKAHMARTFQKTRNEMKGDFQKARVLRQDMIALMQEDEFNEAAYDRLSEEMMAMHAGLIVAKIQTHKQLAQGLPAEDRKLLAKRLSNIAGGKKGEGATRPPRDQNRPVRRPPSTDHVSP